MENTRPYRGTKGKCSRTAPRSWARGFRCWFQLFVTLLGWSLRGPRLRKDRAPGLPPHSPCHSRVPGSSAGAARFPGGGGKAWGEGGGQWNRNWGVTKLRRRRFWRIPGASSTVSFPQSHMGLRPLPSPHAPGIWLFHINVRIGSFPIFLNGEL